MNAKGIISLWLSLLAIVTFAQENGTVEQGIEDEYLSWAHGIWGSLERKTGSIALPKGNVSLNVPDNFYYLSPEDAETVLVQVWGNPPGQHTLGMLFPSDLTPFDEDSWAVAISYEAGGYVSDDNVDNIDFPAMLEQMRSDTAAANKERVNSGYESIELVGWASAPYYDAKQNKLHWAKELRFGDEEHSTLNYNIRVLGRRGYLVLNFIAPMNQQAIVEENLDSVLALAEFDRGARYTDFDPQVDQVASYDIGALVAGKTVTKAGMFASALMTLKELWLVWLIGAIVLFQKLLTRDRSKVGSVPV